MWWIQDAYIVTDRYAYSIRVGSARTDSQLNYIRNGVKVVIDAYNEGLYGRSPGSQIVWCQPLVIPVVDTIIYVEPLYPQSEAGYSPS